MSAISNLVSTIEDDLKAAWSGAEAKVEAFGEEVWSDFKGAFTALIPDEYAILKTAIAGIITGAEDRSLEEVETALLNAGEQEAALVKKLGSALTQALVAVVKSAGVATE